MTMPKFRKLESRYFQESVPLVALDYYDQHSHGEDDFSRKQAWFYSYGDQEIEKEFREGLLEVFESLFMEDDVEWDLITLYPTHSEGEVNPNMRNLLLEVSGDTGISTEQVLRRTKSVKENHVVNSEKEKVLNLEDSIEVTEDVEGKNVILVDNIVISGISMLHGANQLKKHGAENIFSISLGTELEHEDNTEELGMETATELLNKTQQ
ncbi:hypothetical protein AQV86_04500 [Nanohaloarchaea archaeon SG9]|nr:hypothetical protein AQV86_04500 [Nanohaloarchaea archaeon SG9]